MEQWISIPQAAKLFGYKQPDSIRRRLRQLRERGLVQDLGNPPQEYAPSNEPRPVRIYWVNPVTMLLDPTASKDLLIPKPGKRGKQ